MSFFESMLGISVEHTVSLLIVAYTILLASWRFPCTHLSALEYISVIPHIIVFQSAKLSTCWAKHRWWLLSTILNICNYSFKVLLSTHAFTVFCLYHPSFLRSFFLAPPLSRGPHRFCFSFLCPYTRETWSIVCIWFIFLHMVISNFTHFPSNNILLLFFMV